MPDFDGNIKLGVSLEIDRKSLTSELTSVSKEIKKSFSGLGKDVSIVPSSFSNIASSVKEVAEAVESAEPAFKRLGMSFSDYVKISEQLSSSSSISELEEGVKILSSALDILQGKLDSLGSVDASDTTVTSLTNDIGLFQDYINKFTEYIRVKQESARAYNELSKEEEEFLNSKAEQIEETTKSVVAESKKQQHSHTEESRQVVVLKELYSELAQAKKDASDYRTGKEGAFLQNDIQYMKTLETINELLKKINAQESDYRSRQQGEAPIVPTSELGKMKSLLSTLKAQKSAFDKTGLGFASNEEWQLNEQLIRQTTESIKNLENAMLGINGNTVDVIDANDFEVSNQELITLRNRIEELTERKKQLEQAGIGAGYTEYDNLINELGRLSARYNEVQQAHQQAFGSGMPTGITNFISKVVQLKNHLFGLGAVSKKAGNSLTKNFERGFKSFGKGLLNVGKLIFGVRSLFVLFRKLRQTIIQAFSTLAVQFPEINRQMSELKTSLQGLKASLGTALQPLFSALQPLLNSIIQKLTVAIELVAKFFAALTGQGYIYKAKTAWQDYAKSVAGANKQLGKLGAYDKLNVIGPDDNGGNGNTLQGVTYEKQDLEDIFDLDAYGWGQLFGTKLQEALESIPWEEIKQKARNAGTYLAEFLNGFFETTNNGVTLGTAIGKTLAEGFNTGMEFLYAFLSSFHFDSLGKFILDGIVGALVNIDYSLVGKVIGEGIKGILNFGTGLLSIDWYTFTRTMIDNLVLAIQSIDWTGVAEAFVQFLGAAIGAVGGLLAGIWTKFVELGQYIVEGIFNGIDTSLSDIWNWIVEHIFQPFIDGFKKAFGISSPSTVMEEMGEFLIEGLKQGIGNIWEKLGSAFTTFKENLHTTWENIKSSTSNAWENIKSKISGVVTSIKTSVVSIFTSMKTSIGSIFDGIWSKIKGVINSIIGGVERMANGIIAGLNGVISALNGLHFDVPSWVPFVGGNSLGFSIPQLNTISIPRLAQGAVIPPNRQFLAMLGDQSSGTNIEAPLDTIKQALVEALQESGRGGEPIVLQLNSKVIAKAVWDENEKRYKQLGSYAY